jgi:hypothetical protein
MVVDDPPFAPLLNVTCNVAMQRSMLRCATSSVSGHTVTPSTSTRCSSQGSTLSRPFRPQPPADSILCPPGAGWRNQPGCFHHVLHQRIDPRPVGLGKRRRRVAMHDVHGRRAGLVQQRRPTRTRSGARPGSDSASPARGRNSTQIAGVFVAPGRQQRDQFGRQMLEVLEANSPLPPRALPMRLPSSSHATKSPIFRYVKFFGRRAAARQSASAPETNCA